MPGFGIANMWLGRPKGRKDRPALALAVAISDQDGRRHVLALPITHAQPGAAHHRVELPAATKRILGLDDAPSWVITTEAARFAWPGADVRVAPGRATPIYGFVSSALLKSIAQSFLANRRLGETVSFERYDRVVK